MGCGGSRTDALEPRYLESWTKETESTWLTGTDTDIPLSSINSIPSDSSEACFVSEKNCSPVPDFFEDGLPTPAQAYLKACSEASLSDVKPDSAIGQLDAPSPPTQEGAPLSSATTVQRTSVLHTEEITKWQDNRMSTKQVTITVTQSIHQMDKNGKVKKSLTTYEVMKPAEAVKQGAAHG
ncbi:brain and acute leukemia cytoplasmic protein [Corythoichthys intestinalis]|uniref:brain and acute leukemia cytoplasmic protein n=1 Tax=Corythoichthys intestinalis TaxID=161448 RepID=UPI0025A57AA2|nr:brain and acute leukemia cytoplasmic protein [Corythoichthys intestinalis]XP_057679621.1 brain and acute leukemia cytoplasmic protein [Corythoichthys intestinalis]XP_061806391.1 brain and acute leukemia cytoplasmic protein-like [Nerophis lumbriciformis]